MNWYYEKTIIHFLIPIFSFTQSGDTYGDGFVNLEDLFNFLENWFSANYVSNSLGLEFYEFGKYLKLIN